MEGSQCKKLRGDKAKVILVLVIRVMLLVLRETIQVDRQGLLNAIIVKTKDLDTYDSDCEYISNAKAVLMANISNYGSDVILKITPTFYDGIVMSAKHVAMLVIDDDETLILEEEIRSKMSKKGKDSELVKKKVFQKPIIYEKLNRLLEDFGKRFTPQQEMDAEQAFYFRIPNLTIESSNQPPKVSLVNASLKKLKFHLVQFDSMVKKRTTFDARTKETKNVELENSEVKFLSKNKRLCNEINHVKRVFKEQFDSIKKTHVRTKEKSDSLIDKLNLKSVENEDLKAQIQDKVFVITSFKKDLRRIKGKEFIDIATQKPSANTIVPRMFKQDLEPLAHSAKKVAVTPKNNVKKVRFAEPLTSSSNTKQVESSTTSDSNTPALSPTGLKRSTSNCRSKPTCNKKIKRIS
nr:hypothetical protein [Tanacetum cinerariifolium]